jgi:hypothetical protein
MNNTNHLALTSLLIAMQEIDHALALQATGEVSTGDALARIREHVQSRAWIDAVQLARAVKERGGLTV